LSTVCLVLHLHQPLYLSSNFPVERAKRIAEEATLMDKYFDYGLYHRQFLEDCKWVYSPLLNGLLAAAEEGKSLGNPFRFGLCMSGLFLEQLMKEDNNLVSTLSRLVNGGHVELLTTSYYNSPCSVYQGASDELEDQVREHRALMKKVFSAEAKVFANTKLLYNDRVAKVCESLGLSGIIVDDVPLLNCPTPQETYSASSAPWLRLLVRDTRLSFSLLNGELDPAQLPKGSQSLIYLESCRLPRAGEETYRNLALSLSSNGVTTVTPSELIDSTLPAGSLSVPEPMNISSAESNGDFSWFIRSPMQRIYHDRLSSLKPFVDEVGDPRVRGIWRILQQVDLLVAMEEQPGHDVRKVFSSPAEAFSVLNTVYVDFEGKVSTLAQRVRKAKAQLLAKVQLSEVSSTPPKQLQQQQATQTSVKLPA
jgi:alpha-amylase/alpha-mannosidase (GH57 family)